MRDRIGPALPHEDCGFTTSDPVSVDSVLPGLEKASARLVRVGSEYQLDSRGAGIGVFVQYMLVVDKEDTLTRAGNRVPDECLEFPTPAPRACDSVRA